MVMKKKIKDFEKQPVQTDLFNYYGVKTKYSNTIELYESMPKYYYGRQNRILAKDINTEVLPSLERYFTFRERKYRLTVSPARIKDEKTGVSKEYYPSQREEIIEDVIRKMAFQGRGEYYDNLFGVIFSLREIEQELKKYGHGYKREEIKLSILINNRTSLSLESEDKEIQIESHPFETSLLGQKVKKGMSVGEEQLTLVRFNTLVTKSIKERSMRNINIDHCLYYDNPIARYLHKRISHVFQPDREHKKAFRIKLTTVVSDSGMKQSKSLRKDYERIRDALLEMKERDNIKYFMIEPMKAEKPKNKIIDYMLSIFTSDRFTSDIIQANVESRRIKNIEKGK
jgi:hypothetical protein